MRDESKRLGSTQGKSGIGRGGYQRGFSLHSCYGQFFFGHSFTAELLLGAGRGINMGFTVIDYWDYR